ncbi:hypothetical protein CYLTODRAFT_345729 [Cylindrobasidium torrendii FP15055 ss-10]|uniref:Uncharacterized protein n=1 Tax=Cylindrobasidium torrendii FP15055 ss-10 TaxID=1314674 RepID=A0A0D7BLR3_9AGAR|nr:hypothetical protein CYLTODRAFT_345729 [Cylindrobasidium torrendii FP15055 ss-10]
MRSARFSAPSQLLIRTVANSTSNRPGSQSLNQAALNVKEETGNLASDAAKTIAGANLADHSAGEGTKDNFVDITKDNLSAVPKSAMAVGLAGGLPYIGASATTVYLAHQAGLVATGASTIDPGLAITYLDQALNFQVMYGAAMLSSLGAVHWGFEYARYGGQKGLPRIALGAAPAILAIPTLAAQPMMALAAQWMGFTLLWYADARATSNGWAPKWYGQYRFYLSLIAGTCIIGSLAGTSYYGPVGGHGFLTHELEQISSERHALTDGREVVPNDNGPLKISRQKGGPQSPGFVSISHKQEPKEEEKKE